MKGNMDIFTPEGTKRLKKQMRFEQAVCAVLLLATVLLLLAGCGASPNDRMVTLYTVDGKVLKQWKTNHMTICGNNPIRFDTAEGRTTVSGTYTIEPIPEEAK